MPSLYPIDAAQLVWERDLMPGKDVVLDFYEVSELTPEQQEQAQWEQVADSDLDNHVPGSPEIAPHRQWRVRLERQVWMIYQWWEGSGFDDDAYLYVGVKAS